MSELVSPHSRADLLIAGGRPVKTFGPPSEDMRAWRAGLPKGAYEVGHNVLTDRIPLPEVASIIGDRSEAIFLEHYKRPRRWDVIFIPRGRNPLLAAIEYAKSQEIGLETTHDLEDRYDPIESGEIGKAYVILYQDSSKEIKRKAQEIPEKGSAVINLKTEVVDLDRMNDEVIDEDVAYMLESALWVEEYLSDYGASGETDFRIWGGLGSAYHQWIEQESLHIIGIEQILMRARVRMNDGTIKNGFRTPEEIRDLRKAVKKREWIEPFITTDPISTACELTVYPMFQEEVTTDIYQVASAWLEKEAPTVAKLLKMTAGDEKDHYGWFNTGVTEFARLLKELVANTISKVTRHFYMPSDELLDPKVARLRSFHDVVGVNRYSLARHLYVTSLRLTEAPIFNFLDKDKLLEDACVYAGIDPENTEAVKANLLTKPKSRLVI